MIEIRLIDETHKEDVNLKNEPFALWGKMIPTYTGEKWGYSVRKYPPQDVCEMRFPDENYDYGSMCRDSVFLGAYDGGQCIGLAILQNGFFKYMYLSDLKVAGSHRKQGVATRLIEKAKEVALQNGYRGLYTIGQDNNLSACLFYLKAGFVIGGLDTHVYAGTPQEGKADILFYLDA